MNATLICVCVTGLLAASGSTDYHTIPRVEYATPDGQSLKCTLYVPAQEPAEGEVRPALVLIHGGAWMAGTRRQMYWYGRRFAEHGYVVMSISYRTMPGAPFPAPVEDAKSAVRWLRLHAKEHHIDPERIGAMGTSAGGHLALMLAVTRPEDGFEGTENPGAPSDIQAAVSLYGPTDLSVFQDDNKKRILPSKVFWEKYLEAFVGEKSRGKLNPYEAASPISYIGPHVPPVLCVHGEKDSLVPVAQSKRFHERLSSAGLPCEIIVVPKYSHSFDYLHPGARRELFPKIVAFLDEHLKGR